MFGVPQGSVLGSLLFSMYFVPLEEVIRGHKLDCMMYADDIQLNIRIIPREDPFTSLAKLELCIKDVITRCKSNALVCNPSKTEVVHFTSRFAASEPIPSVSVNGTLVIPVNSARSLRVVLDRHLSLSSHMNNVCKSASLAIRNIGRIRRYLSQNDTERLVHAFVTSKSERCNSLIYGLPAYQESKLQRIQNSAVRLVTMVKKFDHISPVSKDLHWLTVRKRITFKILLLLTRRFMVWPPHIYGNC